MRLSCLFPDLIGLLLVGILAGCDKGEIRVYRVSKEAQAAVDSTAQAQPPGLKWKLPPGWQEAPRGTMRAGSFLVKGRSGEEADVSIIPLPGIAAGMLAIVNRWREQVNLPPVAENDLSSLAQPVEVAGQACQLFEQSNGKTNILAVSARRGEVAWFFKMTGNDRLVQEQKPMFVEFLKSVEFSDTAEPDQLPPTHPPLNSTTVQTAGAVASADESKPAWQIPPGWKEAPAAPPLLAKFTVSGPDQSQAVINISTSTGEGGGLAANVNRWRGQLGLQPLAPDEVEKQMQSLALPSGKAMLVEMTGNNVRTGQKSQMIGAIVPVGNRTWFYKLMGDEQVVAKEKDAFVKFVQTATYP